MIHLHCHSGMSYLDGYSTSKEIIDRAIEIGAKHVCISDHGNINVFPEAYKYANKKGINYLPAIEFYVVDDEDPKLNKRGEKRYHMIAIAKNWEGLQCIFRKATLANSQKFNKFPRLLMSQTYDFHDCFISSACSVGFIKKDNYRELAEKYIKAYRNDFYMEIIPVSYNITIKDYTKPDWDQEQLITNEIKRLSADMGENVIVNKDSITNEKTIKTIQIDGGRLVNERVIEIHKELGVQICLTQDSHFTRKEDAEAFEVLLCIQTRQKISTPREKRFFFGDDQIYMKDMKEMIESTRLLGYVPDEIIRTSILTTTIIAEQCNVIMPEFSFNFPTPYPEYEDEVIFKQKIKEGWKRLNISDKENVSVYLDRLKIEIDTIISLDLVRYFLIVEDVMRFCREVGIGTGCGRGSASGSLICLLLGITKRIDPIEHGLYFERFLNKARVSMADIDGDFESKRRGEVLEYLKEKYGIDKVAQIATYGYLSPKSAFRDVCSVYSIPSVDMNKLSKLIEAGVIKENGSIVETYSQEESFDHIQELIEFKERFPFIVDMALKLNGRVRNAGVNAAGVITSSIPLTDLGVIENRSSGFCIGWDKIVSEDTFKLLKLDILGLKTIDVIEGSLKLINELRELSITDDDLPFDNQMAIDEFAKGKTVTIFQFEGSNAQRLLKESGVGTLDNISAISAVNRPGALNAKDEDGVNITTHYVNRVNGSEEVKHFIPQFEYILKDTKSLMIFQEDMIRICVSIAGFSGVEADTFRKIVGKKLSKDEFEKHREKFVTGCISYSNITILEGNKIFDDIIEMAAYSFNKAHAVAYGMNSMMSMYLKVNFSLEYFCSCLTYAGKDDMIPGYIKDAKRYGVVVEYPDINNSEPTKFSIANGKIIAPLNAIKGVGDVAANLIKQVRDEVEFFTGFEHFEAALKERKLAGKVNKRVKDCLVKANTFKKLGYFIDDAEEEEENLRALLSLFSPIPSFKPRGGKTHEKQHLHDLFVEVGNCGAEKWSKQYDTVSPISYAKPNNMIIYNLSTWDSSMLQKDNTKWLVPNLMELTDTPRADWYVTTGVKCSFHGVVKDKIPKECRDKCRLDFLSKEIKIVRPRMILAMDSQIFSWLVGDSKIRFMESFGQIFYSGDFECYVIPCQSPQWVSFQDDARDSWNNEFVPLLKKCYKSA